MLLSGDPNAMPSLHVSTAILLFLFARGRFAKASASLFLPATVLATLATGEHYVIDAIVAAPFACSVHALVHRRFGAAALHAGVLFSWLLLIGEPAPVLASHPLPLRAAALFTVAITAYYALRRTGVVACAAIGPAAASVTLRPADAEIAPVDVPAGTQTA
jgi:hypothetical protein